MPNGPVVRRRKLGEELRSLRQSSGLTSREAARLLGWHQSKVSRVETGASGVTPADVSRLLDAYAVRDTQLRSLFEVLAGSAGGGGSGWWHAYRGLIPPQYRDFISLESQASTVRTLETSVVPGLLQTAGYARAVTRASLDGLPAGRLDSLVEVRLTRQRVLRTSPPLRFTAVLDEAVLHREVGGPEVMRDQLQHLYQVSQLPHVQLQLLPFSVGGYVGLTGPFVIFSFPNISDLDVVVLDHLTSSLYLERKEDLEAYSSAFRTLQAHALSPERSLDLITAISRGQGKPARPTARGGTMPDRPAPTVTSSDTPTVAPPAAPTAVPPPSGPRWKRSSHSTGMNNCVETARFGGTLLAVRDAKDVDRPPLRFSPAAWSTFVAGLGPHGAGPRPVS